MGMFCMAMTMAIGGANLPALKEELDMTTIDVSMFGKHARNFLALWKSKI